MAQQQLISDKIPGQRFGNFKFVTLDREWLGALQKLDHAQLMQLQMENVLGYSPRSLTAFEPGKKIPIEVQANLMDLYQFSAGNLAALDKMEDRHRIIVELKPGDQVPDVANEVRALFQLSPDAVVIFKHTAHPELVTVQKDGRKIKLDRV